MVAVVININIFISDCLPLPSEEQELGYYNTFLYGLESYFHPRWGLPVAGPSLKIILVLSNIFMDVSTRNAP